MSTFTNWNGPGDCAGDLTIFYQQLQELRRLIAALQTQISGTGFDGRFTDLENAVGNKFASNNPPFTDLITAVKNLQNSFAGLGGDTTLGSLKVVGSTELNGFTTIGPLEVTGTAIFDDLLKAAGSFELRNFKWNVAEAWIDNAEIWVNKALWYYFNNSGEYKDISLKAGGVVTDDADYGDRVAPYMQPNKIASYADVIPIATIDEFKSNETDWLHGTGTVYVTARDNIKLNAVINIAIGGSESNSNINHPPSLTATYNYKFDNTATTGHIRFIIVRQTVPTPRYVLAIVVESTPQTSPAYAHVWVHGRNIRTWEPIDGNVTTGQARILDVIGSTESGFVGTNARFQNLYVENRLDVDEAHISELFANEAQVSGDLNVGGHTGLDTVSASNVEVSGDLEVKGDTALVGDVVIGGALTYNSDVPFTYQGDVTFNGSVKINNWPNPTVEPNSLKVIGGKVEVENFLANMNAEVVGHLKTDTIVAMTDDNDDTRYLIRYRQANGTSVSRCVRVETAFNDAKLTRTYGVYTDALYNGMVDASKQYVENENAFANNTISQTIYNAKKQSLIDYWNSQAILVNQALNTGYNSNTTQPPPTYEWPVGSGIMKPSIVQIPGSNPPSYEWHQSPAGGGYNSEPYDRIARANASSIYWGGGTSLLTGATWPTVGQPSPADGHIIAQGDTVVDPAGNLIQGMHYGDTITDTYRWNYYQMFTNEEIYRTEYISGDKVIVGHYKDGAQFKKAQFELESIGRPIATVRGITHELAYLEDLVAGIIFKDRVEFCLRDGYTPDGTKLPSNPDPYTLRSVAGNLIGIETYNGQIRWVQPNDTCLVQGALDTTTGAYVAGKETRLYICSSTTVDAATGNTTEAVWNTCAKPYTNAQGVVNPPMQLASGAYEAFEWFTRIQYSGTGQSQDTRWSFEYAVWIPSSGTTIPEQWGIIDLELEGYVTDTEFEASIQSVALLAYALQPNWLDPNASIQSPIPGNLIPSRIPNPAFIQNKPIAGISALSGGDWDQPQTFDYEWIVEGGDYNQFVDNITHSISRPLTDQPTKTTIMKLMHGRNLQDMPAAAQNTAYCLKWVESTMELYIDSGDPAFVDQTGTVFTYKGNILIQGGGGGGGGGVTLAQVNALISLHNDDPQGHQGITQAGLNRSLEAHNLDVTTGVHPYIHGVIAGHVADTNNPHQVEFDQLGITYTPDGQTTPLPVTVAGGTGTISIFDAIVDYLAAGTSWTNP